ncbi:hypothetical protein [Methanosarcina sp.]|nr:hypothetical protein [Methanosarcina sp.]MDW5550963.1 hypothetical protein [Methanosarcina sp.]MDW5556017.1 hypothetical protein [Methanosarcina sp.]MDW5561540.1 hypothetical protein [Methanosarcina sp.]
MGKITKNYYSNEPGKVWTESSFDEANNLIRMLDKMLGNNDFMD